MAFTLASMIDRLRAKIDYKEYQRDDLSQDGTNYNILLSARPIISGTDTVFITHTTFTTGLNQQVYRYDQLVSPSPGGTQKTYTMDYTRGEMEMYAGSGTVIAATGMVPFAPWNTSTLTIKYQSAKYSDSTLSEYLGYAVASVEASLQLGMYVSGYREQTPGEVSGVVAPPNRFPQDTVNELTYTPYTPEEKFVIADDVEIIKELISQKAAFDIVTRERRIGAGNAIKIVDGDTQIDTSVNQRYLVDLVRDYDLEYKTKLKFVMHNMLEGFTIRQVNELGGEILGTGELYT